MPRKRLAVQRGRRGDKILADPPLMFRLLDEIRGLDRFHSHGRFGCPGLGHPWRDHRPLCFGDPARYTARRRGWRTG